MGSDKPSEEEIKKVLDFLIELRKTFTVQPNTGYCLLIVGPISEKDSEIKVVNPHNLPDQLMKTDDAIQNSKDALYTAIDGLAYNLISLDRSFDHLKELACQAGINLIN